MARGHTHARAFAASDRGVLPRCRCDAERDPATRRTDHLFWFPNPFTTTLVAARLRATRSPRSRGTTTAEAARSST